MIEKTCFSINKKEMWIGGTKNRMPLRSRLIFVCSASSSNQFGWIPPYKTRWGGMMWIGGIGFAEPLAAAGILTTGNKMPLRFYLIFVCSASSSNQFGWIPPNKNKMVLSDHLIFCCGRRGIRTPGTLTRTAV